MKFRTIFADPPWEVKAGTLQGREGFLDANGAPKDLPYPSMTINQIASLPVGNVTDDDGAHLYLCTINKYVENAYMVARAWGFEPSTLLVWAKNTMGGGLGGAYGISTEYVLFCRYGKCTALDREPRTWWNWKRPYDERGKPRHSAKPPELYSMIERVSPGPRLELFARDRRPNWHAWGNEVSAKNEILVPL